MAVGVSRRLRPPSYRHHKPTGRAVVTLNGKDHYLGKFGSPESKEAYDRLIAEWYASGRQVMPKDKASQPLTVAHVIAAFWLHAESYYVGPSGQTTSELDNYRQALRPLAKLYGSTAARDFGPLSLKAVRKEMIDMGWSRRNLNKQVNRIRSMFKWAASQELVPASIYHALQTLAGLQPGRGGAKETEPVRPVAEAHIAAVQPFVSKQVWDLIQLQLLTGARAGELVTMRPVDIDMSSKVWTYSPPHHKTAHHGHKRTINIGPQGQEIIRRYLTGRSFKAYLFSPAEAEAERRARVHAARKTPLSCGNVPGSKQKEDPKRQAGDHYDVGSYRRAISRACEQAFPPPPHLQPRLLDGGKRESAEAFTKRLSKEEKAELAKWKRDHSWHPHQLRHNAATRFRREFGLESAKVLLGHRSLDMTQIYAEADQEKARDAVLRIG